VTAAVLAVAGYALWLALGGCIFSNSPVVVRIGLAGALIVDGFAVGAVLP
jgi:hypothetical protein